MRAPHCEVARPARRPTPEAPDPPAPGAGTFCPNRRSGVGGGGGERYRRGVRTVFRSLAVPVVAALATGALLTGCSSGGSSGPAGAKAALEVPFQTFDGRTTTIAAEKGRPVVVNFWASWCTPCKVEMPDFEKVHQSLGDKVAFVGVNSQDKPADAQKAADAAKVTYTLATDPDDKILTAFEAIGLPMTVFVDKDGKVASVHQGQLSEGALRDAIRSKLGVS